MDKPTDEQIREFWELCGFERRELGRVEYGHRTAWEWNKGELTAEELPPIELTPLFLYAEPVLEKAGYKYELCKTTSSTQHRVAIRDRGFTLQGKLWWDEDLALALFWAIYEVLKE